MENGSLIIERVELKDTGVKYVCNVQTKNGRDTASAFLDVKSESKILSGPKDQPFQEGSDATFDCNFEASSFCLWNILMNSILNPRLANTDVGITILWFSDRRYIEGHVCYWMV